MFLGLRDPRMTLGAQFAQRWDVFESADTTVDVVPRSVERTGQVISLYTIFRPLAFIGSAPNWPLAVTLRADNIKNDTDTDPYARYYIAGLGWEFNKRTSVTFDFQTQEPKSGSTAADTKVFFIHLIAGF